MPIELITGIEPANDGIFKMVKGKDVDLTETTELTTGNLADADSILIDDDHEGTQASTKHTLLSSLWAYILGKIGAATEIIDSDHYVDGSIELAHMSSESVDEDNLHISNAGSNGQFLSKQSGNAGGLTWADASGGATALSAGTVTATSYGITSDGGADDIVLPEATTSAAGLLGADKWDEIVANTAKVTNATHSGDVTGSGALTIADGAVTYAKMQNVSATNKILGRDSAGAGVIEEISPANLLTILGVEASATADQTAGEILTLLEDGIDSVHYKDGSIDNAHIADDAIDSEHYADGSIDTAHIADNAVTDDKLADAINTAIATNLALGTAAVSTANSAAGVANAALPKAGGTMAGNIAMGGNDISGGGDITGTFIGDLTGDVTGTAADATVLETARTIGGVSFNGSANIDLPGVNTTGNQDTSGLAATATLAATSTALATARAINGVDFDGTGAITVTAAGSTLSDTVTVTKGGTGATSLTADGVLFGNGTSAISAVDLSTSGNIIVGGATPAVVTGANLAGSGLAATVGDGTLVLAVETLNQDTTGNAATATALETARTINGTSFDGTGNITITAAGSTLSDTVTVAKGGTGATTLTDNAVLIGNGTDAIESSAYVTHGQGYLNFKGSSTSASGAIRFYEAADNGSATLIVNTPTDYGNDDHVLTLPLDTGTVALTTSSTTFAKTSDTDFSYQGDVTTIGSGSTTQGSLHYYTSSNTWVPTRHDAAATSAGVLLAIALGTDPTTDGMLLRGMFTLGADPGTIAGPLYVGSSSGSIDGTAPTTSGYFVRIVGYCLDSTNGQIWFNPDHTWVEIA
jgi:hypothetical protein